MIKNLKYKPEPTVKIRIFDEKEPREPKVINKSENVIMKSDTVLSLKKHFGNQEKIAGFLGNKPATVSYWLRGRYPIPIRYAVKLADETGISFHDLRPDIPRNG